MPPLSSVCVSNISFNSEFLLILLVMPVERESSYYLFIGWAGVFIAIWAFSLVAVRGSCLQLWSMGFSLLHLFLLQSTGSRHEGFSSCDFWALEHRLSSSSTWVQLLPGLWGLPGPGTEPVSPVLAGRFFTTETTSKAHVLSFNTPMYQFLMVTGFKKSLPTPGYEDSFSIFLQKFYCFNLPIQNSNPF